MSSKKVWFTWMPKDDSGNGPQQSLELLIKYGLIVSGDYWIDDLKKMAWVELANQLITSTEIDVWIIAGKQTDIESFNNRYGLSMISAMLADERKKPLTCICLGLDFMPAQESLPTLLSSFQCLSCTDENWVSKVVTAAYMPETDNIKRDFRFNVIAHPMLGQWFEIGPLERTWSSVMLGVSKGSEITHHAVGERGQLPEKSILEYPTEGIQAKMGEDDYIAWSVQNNIGPEHSYFTKIDGYPQSVIIGGHPDEADTEVSCIKFT